MHLIFSTGLGSTSGSDSRTDAGVMLNAVSAWFPIAVQLRCPVGPVLPERYHLLIQRFWSSEVSRVLLDPVERRRSMLSGRCQADLAVISGVGEAPFWCYTFFG